VGARRGDMTRGYVARVVTEIVADGSGAASVVPSSSAPATHPPRRTESDGRRARSTVDGPAEYQIAAGVTRTSPSTRKGHVAGAARSAPSRHRPLRARRNDLKARGLALPLLMRFSDILGPHQAHQRGFSKAISEYNYSGSLPRRLPVEGQPAAARRRGGRRVRSRPWRYGLEAGSKPELLIALAAEPGARRADHLQRLQGREVHRDGAPRAGLRQDGDRRARAHRGARLRVPRRGQARHPPVLGVRAKLTARASAAGPTPPATAPSSASRRRRSSRSSTACRKRDMLDCLQLLHFHIGSQISASSPSRRPARGVAHLRRALPSMGAPDEVPRRRRRPRRRLRRQQDGLPRVAMNYDIHEYAVRRRRRPSRRPARTPTSSRRRSSARAGARWSRTSRCSSSRSSARARSPSETPWRPGRTPTRSCGTCTRPTTASRPRTSRRPTTTPRRPRRGLHALQVRLPLAARAGRGREALLGSAASKILRLVRGIKQVPEELQELERIMARSTTATSPSSSPRPTAGPSTSSSRSCRSTGSTRSRR
jgi:hypothetical protein